MHVHGLPARAAHRQAREDGLQPRSRSSGTCTGTPASMHYEYGADRDGRLVYARHRAPRRRGLRVQHPRRRRQRGHDGFGPYEIPNLHMDCYGAYTNNPPCGAMRGRLGADGVRGRGDHGPARRRGRARSRRDPGPQRLPRGLDRAHRAGDRQRRPGGRAGGAAAGDAAARAGRRRRLDLRRLPGGVANTTHGEGIRRGVGYAVAYKNVAFSEGFDDYSTARVRLSVVGATPWRPCTPRAPRWARDWSRSSSRSAAPSSASSGWSSPEGHRVGSAGSSSASRQTYVTGGRSRPLRERPQAGADPRRDPAGHERRRAPARGRRRGRRPERSRSRLPTCSATTSSRTPSSGGTGRRTPSTPRPGRGARTCSTPSRRTAVSSTWTSSAWSRSSSSPAPRTSAGR